MKKKLFLLLCALLTMVGVQAQTDVTSTYLTNADFEGEYSSNSKPSSDRDIYLPSGWTLSYTDGETNDMTSLNSTTTQWNNFSGRPQPANGGSNTYWIRFRWGNSENLELSQTVTLPAGIYTLSVDAFLNASAKGVATISAAGKTTNVTNNNTWGSYNVTFSLIKSTEVKIACSLKQNQQEETVAAFDNFTLTYTAFDNPVTPIANNTTDLYFKNETTGQFLSAGHSWGTHATVDNYGQEITATMSEGIYSLKTQQYNAYLNNLYMDNGTSTPSWLFLETAASSGKYYMTQDGINYLTSNGAGAELVNVTSPTDASIWTIVSKADRKTSAMSSATIDTPSDVTFLIADANFNRNANSSVWNGDSHQSDGETKNLSLAGGNNDNMCAESYHAVFSINQTLTGLSDGVYGLTAQGFYRQDGSDNEHLPYFYLGEEKATFPLKTGAENSMADASTSFSAGLYTIAPIYVRVESGSVELGAKLTDDNYNLWCIWDNFQLKYYGDVTLAAVKMKASVDAYNAAMDEAKAFTESSMWADDWTALQTAITENTIDLNDPDLTEEQLNTATANLVAANAAATTAVNSKTTYDNAVALIDGGTNVNVTSLIINPSFESDGTGWANSGMGFQTNDAFGKTGSKYAEAWQPNGTKSISQTISVLPAGIYQLSVRAKARGVTSAKIFANTNELALTIGDVENELNLTFDIDDRTAINLGFEGVGTGAANSWLALDNFRLTFVGSVDDLTYTLATGKMDPDKAAAQTAAETEFLANKNLTTYNALLAAIADAEASVANYEKLKAAIDKANGVKDANNFVTAAATTAFENEINAATTAWTNETYSDAEALAEINTLGSAVSGWHAIDDSGKAGSFMASAWGKTHENWWEAPYINTWSAEGDNDGTGFSVPFFEYFADANQNLPAKTMTATLTGLENGFYEVELWARVQRRSDADFNADNSMITMSVNEGEAVSIMSDTEHNVGSGTSVMRLGHYTASGIVTDGTLTLSIDVKLGANVHWLTWRDVKYTMTAPATVSATIGATGWTTFASTYPLDLSKMTASTGNVKAYYASSIGDGKIVVTSTESEGVAAGTGLMLKGTAGATITIPVAASGDAISGNMLVGCTTETPVAASASCYVLVNNGGTAEFQSLSAHGATIPAGKAYLNTGVISPARLIISFDEEDPTAINAVEAVDVEANGLKDGKYLIGNKVVLVKNGVKYGANGQKLN